MRGIGLRGKGVEEAGPLRKGCWTAGWVGLDGFWVWAEFWFWVSGFLSYLLFQTKLKLFEFKHKFEFKSYALNQNKTMHQHECNNMFKPIKILFTYEAKLY